MRSRSPVRALLAAAAAAGLLLIGRRRRARHTSGPGSAAAARQLNLGASALASSVLPAERFFSSTLLKTVVGIYYAHPAAWSEVGFGGPASPRGYVRRELGMRDAWEAREEWNPAAPAEEQ